MSEPKRKRSETKHEPKRIGLLGASFDTGNMGVSALAESSIKCILHRWPDAEVALLDSDRAVGEHRLRIGDKDLCIRELPIRFCKNVFLDNHFLVLCLYAFLFKLFRWERFKRFCARRNASLNCILQMDVVADITGGDSFSDIYGMRRFVFGFLHKWLVLLLNKDLVMLPQTYGPFKRRLARVMARHILKRASLVYSRDRAGVEYVNKVLNDPRDGKVRFAPDVAFVLDSHEPENINVGSLDKVRTKKSVVVGVNVSGILFNGGYTRDNMFSLKTDYRQLICAIVELLLKDLRTLILLVPHVFPPSGYEVESDPDACLKVYEHLHQQYPGRIFLVKGEYDQGEIKYVIGLCDFFIGSRMHSCIAALSQCIPAVGIAYSKKFEGVFESIGLADCVVDMRNLDEGESLKKLESLFECRDQIREHLVNVMPKVKNDIYSIFEKSQLTKVWAEC